MNGLCGPRKGSTKITTTINKTKDFLPSRVLVLLHLKLKRVWFSSRTLRNAGSCRQLIIDRLIAQSDVLSRVESRISKLVYRANYSRTFSHKISKILSFRLNWLNQLTLGQRLIETIRAMKTIPATAQQMSD